MKNGLGTPRLIACCIGCLLVVVQLAIDGLFVEAFSPPIRTRSSSSVVQPFRFLFDKAPSSGGSSASLSSWSSSSSTTRLRAKLWDRLEIEEDEEPMWYLLNCVAGLELDLLRQCREICKDMPDAVKFVVPTEQKTRSHGANRMVTETKVRYLGYVFGKLRLCEEVYEAIQGLDFCRSWMGTVNRKGYKKLPPSPLALNEDEIEKFGLEDLDDRGEEVDGADEDESGVIVDEADDEEEVKAATTKKALKVYLGLKVEDMVKVTASGKFLNEDGIVRRLKEGKIFVKFYTYGTMYEEWLDPKDVRKLSNEEILKGLSGPSQPITQRDFDGPQEQQQQGGRPTDRNWRDNSDSRRNSAMRGGGDARNRRQDRTASRYSSRDRSNDLFGRSDDERRREERNWSWYQDQQRQKGGGNVVASEGDASNIRSGSQQQQGAGDGDWALGDVDSQWGRKPQRQRRREEQTQKNKSDNRRAGAAIDGSGDWSSFVSSPSADKTAPPKSGSDSDDFFDSLMSDLSNDLGSSGASSTTKKDSSKASEAAVDEDEFFASLMSDLTEATSDEKKPAPTTSESRRSRTPSPPPRQKESVLAAEDGDMNADDFFASLEAELGEALEGPSPAPTGDVDTDDSDDFFAKLEAELSPSAPDSEGSADMPDPTLDGSRSTKAPAEKPPSPVLESQQPSKASAPISAAPSNDLGKCTVPVLKDMLRERGLKVSGKKSELLERLSTSGS